MEFTTGETKWQCASCLEWIPYGFEHICKAKSGNDQIPAMFPGQLSMVEVNKKLDETLALLDEVKKDLKEIKDKDK